MSFNSIDDSKIVCATNVLISEVRTRPVLWNNFVKRTYRDCAAAWSEVSRAMNMNVSVLKPKWKNLRDMFKREHLKTKSLGKPTTWRYYESLKFLEINFTKKKTYKKRVKTVPVNALPSALTTIIKLEPIDNPEMFQCDNNVIDPIGITNPVLMNVSQDPTPQEQAADHDLMFLKSLLPFFRDLTPARKLVVRTKMQEILLNEVSKKYVIKF